MSTLSNLLGGSQSSTVPTRLPSFKPRNIVILLDGTGNQFSRRTAMSSSS